MVEALKGDYAGFFSIRVNDQYRIVFRFEHTPATSGSSTTTEESRHAAEEQAPDPPWPLTSRTPASGGGPPWCSPRR